MMIRSRERRQLQAPQGLGAVASIVVLVLLSGLAASIARLGWTEQVTFAQDIDTARATQAANAGIEWAMYQALKGSWASCPENGSTQSTLDLRAQTGFMVAVSCASKVYVEGPTASDTTRLYSLEAIACNSSTACPDDARLPSPTYVERRRRSQIVN